MNRELTEAEKSTIRDLVFAYEIGEAVRHIQRKLACSQPRAIELVEDAVGDMEHGESCATQRNALANCGCGKLNAMIDLDALKGDHAAAHRFLETVPARDPWASDLLP